MKVFNVMLVIAVALLVDEAKCGVIGSVYGEISNRTQAVKDDVYSWWSYGVDSVMGSDGYDNQYLRSINDNAEHAINNTKAEVEKQSGIISGIYNKFKGGVSYGYMKVHDVVLGNDSDPNKGIIRTFYERAMRRLKQIKEYIFGGDNTIDPQETQEKEDDREAVLKVLFGNNSNLFNDENERKALESLRHKLTEAGDHTLQLVESERKLITKAYDSIRNKADEFKTDANTSVVKVKDHVQENIDKTQEFIKDASGKVNQGVQNFGEDVKESVQGVQKKFESE